MQTTQIAALNKTIQKAHSWIKELMELGKFPQELDAYSSLRAVLHALRDRMPVDQAAQLGAQLPMVIRGLYYEGWKPSATPLRIRNEQEFVELVQSELRPNMNVQGRRVIGLVLHFLEHKVSEGEMGDIQRSLPPEILRLWPTEGLEELGMGPLTEAAEEAVAPGRRAARRIRGTGATGRTGRRAVRQRARTRRPSPARNPTQRTARRRARAAAERE